MTQSTPSCCILSITYIQLIRIHGKTYRDDSQSTQLPAKSGCGTTSTPRNELILKSPPFYSLGTGSTLSDSLSVKAQAARHLITAEVASTACGTIP